MNARVLQQFNNSTIYLGLGRPIHEQNSCLTSMGPDGLATDSRLTQAESETPKQRQSASNVGIEH
jgi:hypothetical protein